MYAFTQKRILSKLKVQSEMTHPSVYPGLQNNHIKKTKNSFGQFLSTG